MLRIAAIVLLLVLSACDPTFPIMLIDEHYDAIETQHRQECLAQPGPPSKCWGD